MGSAASTTWPDTLFFGRVPFAGMQVTVRPVTSPGWTLHCYVDEWQGARPKDQVTLCGRRMTPSWHRRSLLPRTECAHCQRILARNTPRPRG